MDSLFSSLKYSPLSNLSNYQGSLARSIEVIHSAMGSMTNIKKRNVYLATNESGSISTRLDSRLVRPPKTNTNFFSDHLNYEIIPVTLRRM